MDSINEVLRLFGLEVDRYTAEKFDSGHINQTFRVTFDDKSYILQRLNPSLFTCPDKMMKNISLVCKCAENSLNFLTCSGKNYLKHDGAAWRMYEYVPDSVSYDTLDDDDLVYEFGSILAKFHRDTDSIDPKELFVTIEDFHNTKKRIEKLLSLRVGYTHEFEKLLTYSDRLSKKNIPLKAMHNDVKCSNVLFDKNTGKALALIDLDTVMPGRYVYDMGDGIRSACVSDDRLDVKKLRAFCKGYFSLMGGTPNAEEIFLGLVCVTAELSARYLFDAYSGENYFADKTREQKIIRGEQLLKLALSAAENEREILKVIGDCA